MKKITSQASSRALLVGLGLGLLAIGVVGDVRQASSAARTAARTTTMTTQMYNGKTDSTRVFNAATLTSDGSDVYTVSAFPGVHLFVSAPISNRATTNLRQIYWPANDKKALNARTCATWLGESDSRVQEGLALRINSTPEKTTAITLTKNVIYGINWVFNVHTWDSSNTAQPFVSIAQFDMSKVMYNELGRYQYMPWRVCAQATGSTFKMKIWFPQTMKEPSWNDKMYTAQAATIPAAYQVSGNTGWYAGHIPANGDVEYSDMSTWMFTNVLSSTSSKNSASSR